MERINEQHVSNAQVAKTERAYTRQLQAALREVMPAIKFHAVHSFGFDFSLNDWRAPVAVILKQSQIRFRFGRMTKKGVKYQWRHPSDERYQTVKMTFTYDEFDVMAPYFAAMCRALILQDADLLPLPPLPMCIGDSPHSESTTSMWRLETGKINEYIYEHTIRGWAAQKKDFRPLRIAPTANQSQH